MPTTPDRSNRAHLPIKRRVRVYLAENDMTQVQLANMLRIKPGHLSGILAQTQIPSLRVAVELENLTGIPAREFNVDLHEQHPVAGR